MIKKIFVKCEGLNGIIVLSLVSYEESKVLRFQKEQAIIGLNSTPNSFEISEITRKSPLGAFEEFIDMKGNEGCILWYRNKDIGFPCPIVVNAQDLHSNDGDENGDIKYSAIPDALTNFIKAKTNILSQFVGSQNSYLKRVRISD